jgi:spore cortex formation protein SpoVR/YcgB (stage V sporulation)
MDQIAFKATADAKARRATVKQEQLMEASKQEADRGRKRDEKRQAKQSTRLAYDPNADLKNFLEKWGLKM